MYTNTVLDANDHNSNTTDIFKSKFNTNLGISHLLTA